MFYIKENGSATFSRTILYRNTVVSEERDYFAATTCILKWPSLRPSKKTAGEILTAVLDLCP